MNKQTEALTLALEALAAANDFLFNWHENESDNEADQYATARQLGDKAMTAIRKKLAEQPAPPPECKTDAEKTAFAFGWWKALEENRKQTAQQQATPEDLAKLGWQSIECPFCGSSGAQAFPKPVQQQEPHIGWLVRNSQGKLDLLTDLQIDSSLERYERLHKLYTSLQPAQQEPVAWITKNGKGWLRWHKPEDSEKNKDSIPLYTAPTSKPWVGLTDDEIALICAECSLRTPCDIYYARAIEAKLKEKNI